jgi:hypothetical protein
MIKTRYYQTNLPGISLNKSGRTNFGARLKISKTGLPSSTQQANNPRFGREPRERVVGIRPKTHKYFYRGCKFRRSLRRRDPGDPVSI